MRDTALDALGSGWFSDVALAQGRGYLIGAFDVAGGVEVRVESWRGLDVMPRETLFSEHIGRDRGYGYSRVYVWNNSPLIAFHDGVQGHMRNLVGYDPAHPENGHMPLAPCEGSSPVCFGNGYFAWQGAAAQGYPVSRMNLRNGEIVADVRKGSPTGLSRVDENGTVRTIDEDRFEIPGVTNPVSAGDLSVAEGADGGAFWRLKGATPKDDKTGVLWAGLDSFVPRCAVDGETVAVCTGGGVGVRVFCGSRAELLAIQATPIVAPPPPPEVPPPAPKPVDQAPPPVVKPPVGGTVPSAAPPAYAGVENGFLTKPYEWFLDLVSQVRGHKVNDGDLCGPDWRQVVIATGIPVSPADKNHWPTPFGDPFFGVTQWLDSSGKPMTRLTLTATAKDDQGWQTRVISYVKDPNVSDDEMRWGTFFVRGGEHMPYPATLVSRTGTPPPPTGEEPPTGEKPPSGEEPPPVATPEVLELLKALVAGQAALLAGQSSQTAAITQGMDGVKAAVKEGVKIHF